MQAHSKWHPLQVSQRWRSNYRPVGDIKTAICTAKFKNGTLLDRGEFGTLVLLSTNKEFLPDVELSINYTDSLGKVQTHDSIVRHGTAELEELDGSEEEPSEIDE